MPPAAKYALSCLLVQAEFGLNCPLSMTDSLARTLRKFGDPALVQCHLLMLTTQDFDALGLGPMFMNQRALLLTAQGAAAGHGVQAAHVR